MPPRARAARFWLLAAGAALVAGCASTPPESTGGATRRLPAAATPDRDGPHPEPPADLERVPDAEPRVEPLRVGGPNKPYEVLGQRYTPITTDTKVVERGLASWYGRKFHGRPTASGEPYDMHAMTAAHPRLPIPSYARVRNPANGREVIVRINDRGPFHPGRIVDLSYTAALRLGLLRGVGLVELERLTQDEIRTGSWRREGTAVAAAPASGSIAPAEPRAEAGDASPAATAVPVADAATASPPPDPSAAPRDGAVDGTSGGFWVQLGAFRERASALSLQQRVMRELSSLVPSLAVFADRGAAPHRVQAGPYASRDEATRAARQLGEQLSLSPRVVERASARR